MLTVATGRWRILGRPSGKADDSSPTCGMIGPSTFYSPMYDKSACARPYVSQSEREAADFPAWLHHYNRK